MAQFRTKARAVELLGKGQIADLPTAISELWKKMVNLLSIILMVISPQLSSVLKRKHTHIEL